jgi:ABC-type oligopeptide transport system substrate-binding subunit/class 3 adenylate cyclase
MTEREQLEQAIAALEAQRDVLGDATVDAALGPIRKQLAVLSGSEEISRQAIDGERKLATVMFADISGFTALLDKQDPETVRELVNVCFKRFVPIIRKYGGTVEKFIGDEVMAIFGAPIAHEDDPERAVRTALDMMDELTGFNADNNIDMQIHIGISTGLVIAGAIGSEDEQQYGVIGDTVNLAKRLEEAAPAGGILISTDTYRLVKGVFNVMPQDPIQVKGKTSPVDTYLVENIKPRAFRMEVRGVEGIEIHLVGRDAELLTLQNIFHDAVEGSETRIVTMVGEAGIGKSRLLFEFEEWIELLPTDVRYFKGWTSAGMEAEPFGVVRQMFTHRFEILKSDSIAVVNDKLRSGMEIALDRDQADQVGHLLGFDLPISPALKDALDSGSFRDRAIGYLIEYLQIIAQDPTTIFLEDIHWADDSSLDLIDHIVQTLPNSRLMIVCLARPSLFERRPHWGEGQKAHSTLEIRALSRRKSRALVDEILRKAEKVPDKIRNMIVDVAEGNPFYVEELIKMLIDDGVIQEHDGRWWIELERLDDIRIPNTLAGVIQARLDSLPVNERAVLQRASVVGRLFWDMAVAELAVDQSERIEKKYLSSLLDSARARELIFRREYSTFDETNEYIFKHALLRDVTYETVLLKLRKIYHRQVARWLETVTGDRLGEYLGLVASHYELAGDHEKAVEYLLRMGDRARMAYAHQEAIDAYQRALTIQKAQDNLGDAARTLMRLGLVHHTAFDFKRSREAYEQGFTLWRQAEEIHQKTASSSDQSKNLRVIRGAPYSLDPTLTDHTDSSVVILQLFSGLVESGTTMEVMPDVARSWEISEGGRRYRFYLRDDVHWSDGHKVTSNDYKFAWIRTLDPSHESPNASLLYDIKGAKAFHTGQITNPNSLGIRTPDDLTLDVELEGQTAYFLSLLACTATFPIPRHAVNTHGESWTEVEKFASNGPFTLKEWTQGKSMILSRNPDYHGRFRGSLQELEFVFNIEKTGALESYQTGELDILSLENIPPSEWNLARRRHAGDYVSSPEPITNYVGFDVSRPPFDDPRVRQAFALATDKISLSNVVLGGYMFPATGGFIPPGVPAHTPKIGLGYDPDRARQLLAEAGFPGGEGFPTIEALARERVRPQSEFLEAQWSENLGVEIKWQFLPWRDYLEKLDQSPSHLFQFGWMADYPDPDSFLRTGNIQQRTRWRDKTYDGLVEKARRVLEQNKRLKLYKEADRILAEEVVIIPLTYSWSHLLVKPRVRNFPASPINQWLWKDVLVEDR